MYHCIVWKIVLNIQIKILISPNNYPVCTFTGEWNLPHRFYLQSIKVNLWDFFLTNLNNLYFFKHSYTAVDDRVYHENFTQISPLLNMVKTFSASEGKIVLLLVVTACRHRPCKGESKKCKSLKLRSMILSTPGALIVKAHSQYNCN